MPWLQKPCSKKQSDTDPTWPTLTTTCKCVPYVTTAELTTNFVSRGILLQNSGRLSEEALSYHSAIKFRPKLVVAYLNLGVTAVEVKRAISVLLNGVKQGGKENMLNLLGESYQALGEVETAEEWYSKSLQANLAHVPAHLTLAKMLVKNVSSK